LNESFIKKSFSINVLTLAGGTAMAQGIGLLMVPLLTRLYSPSDYGYYAQYTAFFNLIVPLVHFRYALAIMLPKEDHDALEIFRLCLRISIFSGVALFAIIFFSNPSFFVLPGITDNNWILALIALAIVVGGITQSYTEWSNRAKNYVLMSLSRVFQVGGMVLTQSIAGVTCGSTIFGLIFGHILGGVFGLGALTYGNKNLKGKSLFLSPIKPLINSLTRYKRFPLFTSWGGILDGVSSYGTPILFAIYFQPDMVGKYALATTALSAPVMLIGHSVSKVLYQKMSENLKNGLDIKTLVNSILLRLTLISLCTGLVIYFFGPTLFGFFFGSNWVSAGHFAQILIPAMFFQFILSGTSTVLLVKERQDLLLVAQAILALTTVVSILVPGMANFSETQSLAVFSFSRATANMIYLAIICRVARVF
jgi:lipopolysaccharide exporter